MRSALTSLAAIILILVTTSPDAHAGGADTVRVNASDINTRVLIPGVHRYLVYFKHGKDSSRVMYQMWTREIKFVPYDGNDAVSITQSWENNNEVFHTATSYCDRKTFAPLYHEIWWKTRGKGVYDFVHGTASVDGKPLPEATDSAGKARWSAFDIARKQYVLNWHLDLEVFSTLPFKDGRTFLINYYDPGYTPPEWVAYTVSGSGALDGYDHQKIDCWLLKNNDPRYEEVFWISKKTHEVLKLEEHYGNTYRYKIMIPYSV
ncbi:MAG TPA: hypothetical protein VMM37_08050 [Bacteroidota bacterium]|nr:hypothetical protein [Bacteroidota bacterium]